MALPSATIAAIEAVPVESPADSPRPTSFHLLHLYRGGDQAAFAELHDRHAAAVRRSIAARLGIRLRDLLDVDDVLQESFVALLAWFAQQPVGAVPGEGGVRHLLVKIAMQKIADAGRAQTAQRRDCRRRAGLEDLDEEPADPAARPSQGGRVAEIEEALEGAMLRLDPDDRALLDMRYNLAMESREIAEHLGLGLEVARVRLSRAKGRLQAQLGHLR